MKPNDEYREFLKRTLITKHGVVESSFYGYVINIPKISKGLKERFIPLAIEYTETVVRPVYEEMANAHRKLIEEYER